MVQVEVAQAGPRLHVVYLRHPTVNVCRRDNELGIMCVLAETVARGDRVQVGGGDNVGCGSNGRSLDDAGRDFAQTSDP